MFSSQTHKLFFNDKTISTALPYFKFHFMKSSGKSIRYFSKLQETIESCFHDRVSLLQHLGNTKEVKFGKSLHSFYTKSGFHEDVFVQNNLIRFYVLCDDIVSARLLFDEMPEPNLVSWTSMISAYVNQGQHEIGLKLFSLMYRSGLSANDFGFSVALKACRILRDFVMGKLIHGQVVKLGFESCNYCSASILGMYGEYSEGVDARKFFDGIPLQERSEASWNTLLCNYMQLSDLEGAVGMFTQMMCCSILPNCFTYSILIKLCAMASNFDFLRLFHAHVMKFSFEKDIVAGGALVDAYAKLGFVDHASKVFKNLEKKDNTVWCTVLAGFHQTGNAEQGIKFYLDFLSEGNKPDCFIYATVFSLCSNLEDCNFGTQIHCTFVKDGYLMDAFLGSTLIDMYGSLGRVLDSYKCFHNVRTKNEVCFSSMMNILLLYSHDEAALELFSDMMSVGLLPSYSIVNYAARACANLNMKKEGSSLHSYVVKNLYDCDSKLSSSNDLIEMYAKFGAIGYAEKIVKRMELQNEYSWTAIISGCCELGLYEEALRLFQEMIHTESTKPSEFTIIAVIQACSKQTMLEKGKQIHGYVVKVGFEGNTFVESALINMYAGFKDVQNAFLVFSLMEEKDLVSWSTMVTAWAQNGYNKEALNHFAEFQNTPNFTADEWTLSSCLSACAGLVALEKGMMFHAYAIRTGFTSHLYVASSVIDMYSKCGNINDARKFFDAMENNNSVCLTAMMSGYAHHGLGKEVVEMFRNMKESGLKPDSVTFIGVLTACSHAGLVSEGLEFFNSMRNEYRLEMSVNHYACMVDLLGRAEQVEEAEDLIKKAPFDSKSKSLLWKTLLGACNKYGNIEVGKRIAQMVVDLEPDDPSTYVLISNIYASAEMWNNSVETRNRMRTKHVNKNPGYSRIQVES